MRRWKIIAKSGCPTPLGTTRVIRRKALANGNVEWIVEAADFIQILPSVLQEIISVTADRDQRELGSSSATTCG